MMSLIRKNLTSQAQAIIDNPYQSGRLSDDTAAAIAKELNTTAEIVKLAREMRAEASDQAHASSRFYLD